MKNSLRIKMIVIFSSIVLISCLVVSYLSYSSSSKLVEDSISQVAGTMVKEAAEMIDAEKYEQQITLESGETEYYHQLREQLNEFREKTGLTYLYTMARKQVDGAYEYYYMADGMPVGSEGESSLGDKEEEIDSFPAMVETFEKESLQVAMTYSDEWGGNVSAYYPIKAKSGDVIGIIGADLDVTHVYHTMNVNKEKLLITTLLILIISVAVILAFTYYLLKPLKDLTTQVKLVGEGDLTSDIQIDRTDEIGALADATKKMQQNIRDMIYNISQVSDAVFRQSEELNKASNEVKQGSTQVASTMQELASAMDTQAKASNVLTNEMDSFAVKIEETNKYGGEISVESNRILGLANEGSQLMNTSMKQMDLINGIMNDAVNKVQNLNQQSQEISTLVDVINTIANQTNLLALNASIEAARAGEQGKGFAVVADEVKKLAEQVSSSVLDITEIVENIQAESKTMVQSLDEGYVQVQEGSRQIQSTGEAFNKINSSVTGMADRIEVISGNLGDISQNSLLINESIEKIATIADEVASSVEQTTASIQQTHSSMEEISDSADDLAHLAENLNGRVKTFHLE
ncbi:MAG TPA: methyl-accepting chemotaxis protein [Bacillaceae bacterium]